MTADQGRELHAETAVELDGIAQRFGSRWVLRGVTLRVAAGEIVALTGRNGSGKSTILRVIATLLRPTRGAFRVFGIDGSADADAVRAHVGLLGHSTGLYPDLTAAENLRFAARMLGVAGDANAIGAALGEVGLARDADERVRHFSSGMQRRLALARLRIQRPKLLLLDEPYNSIDAEGSEMVNALLVQTREAGGAALVVTHDLTRGLAVTDRVEQLEGGRIVRLPLGRSEPRQEARVLTGPWGNGRVD